MRDYHAIHERRVNNARIFGTDASTLTRATAYGSIPGWDSVNHLRLVMETEKAFGVRFDVLPPEGKTGRRSLSITDEGKIRTVFAAFDSVGAPSPSGENATTAARSHACRAATAADASAP